ncbi:MAG TPA: 4Fe-4S binding protein [Chthonomonadales bacterium]|nr:4Fe-4S binding protein [Chthonomonadales bacterium]
MPVTPAPNPRPDLFNTIDVVLLVVVMALAAYYVLGRRSRREAWVLVLFSVLYFGFYRAGCVCSVGSIQNVALAAVTPGYALPFAAGAFFILPLVFALFFGRVFCAAACPLGALQDLVLHRPKRVPGWLDHSLSVLPYIVLGVGVLLAATGSMFLVCEYDPFVGFYRLSGPIGILIFGGVLLAIATVVGRPYCRYLCPYSVLLRWCSSLARWRVRVTPDECVQCHLCADACPFGAIKPPQAERVGVNYRRERSSLSKLLVALPVVVALGAYGGWLAGPALARTHHAVRTADRLWQEDRGLVRGTTDETTAFRRLGEPYGAAYARAVAVRRQFSWGSATLGAWCALVIVLKLAALRRRRTRVDYEADASACVACGRCFASCPVDLARKTGQPVELILERRASG